MLCIFSLAFTPKLLIHYAIASHKDNYKNNGKEKFQLAKSGFNCKANDLVSTSPYDDTQEFLSTKAFISFISQNSRYSSGDFASADINFKLRGPPSI